MTRHVAPVPVAGIDRIDDAATALALLDEVMSSPPAHETLVILLDEAHRGSAIIHVDGTVDDDAVLEVTDLIAGIAQHRNDIGGVVIATMRPGRCDVLADLDRWLTIDEQLAIVGIELIEWFVIGRSVSCPRALFGDASRWAT